MFSSLESPSDPFSVSHTESLEHPTTNSTPAVNNEDAMMFSLRSSLAPNLSASDHLRLPYVIQNELYYDTILATSS